MGQQVEKLIKTEFSKSCIVSAAPSRNDSLEPLLKVDVVIDFSSAGAMASLARLALLQSSKVPAFVIGSTGWTDMELEVIKHLSHKTTALESSNFSTGIYTLRKILKDYSPFLKKLGYTPTLLEVHHEHKKDAPSGTALSLQKEIDPLHPGQIQTHSIRAGEVIGDHTVTFYGKGDRITVSHSAQDRSIFARGAIEVALWLAQSRESKELPTGLLNMDHYFNALKSKGTTDE